MKNGTATSVFLKLLFSVAFVFLYLPVHAQEDSEKAGRQARKLMSEAEEALKEEDFATAEAFYRKAIAKDPSNAAARYNMGNLYHNRELSAEAVVRHAESAEIAEERSLRHKAFHNKGNSFMDQEKYPEAIEAYKDALRNNPQDDESRYNLALAKKKLEEEQKNQGKDDKEDKESKDKKEQENKEQENKEQQGDQGDQEQDKQGNPQDQKGGDKEDKQQQDSEKDGEGEQQKEEQGEGEKEKQQPQQQQQQPVPGQLSPQQVKNLLEAMGNEEKKVQEKMNAKKVKGVPAQTEKDW